MKVFRKTITPQDDRAYYAMQDFPVTICNNKFLFPVARMILYIYSNRYATVLKNLASLFTPNE